MSSLPVTAQLEVLDLRQFSGRQLRPLLEAEAELWNRKLRWDYTGSTELLLQYLEARVLQGYAALIDGRICGYAFAVFEGNKAVIGDAFAVRDGNVQDLGTTRTLLVHILELLRNTPMVDRIESQILLARSGELSGVFREEGSRVFPRLFEECDLASGGTGTRRGAALPKDITVSQWMPQDYQPAGELIHAAYEGHTDAEINDQYRSLHGALRFLHNIVRFPGCGTFEPAYSWVLREHGRRAPIGLVLASRVSPDVAHITQFCIAREHRGRGLGAALLQHTRDKLRDAGFRAITLTVTESNQPAVRLYESFGFRQRHRFDAFVLETGRGR